MPNFENLAIKIKNEVNASDICEVKAVGLVSFPLALEKSQKLENAKISSQTVFF